MGSRRQAGPGFGSSELPHTLAAHLLLLGVGLTTPNRQKGGRPGAEVPPCRHQLHLSKERAPHAGRTPAAGVRSRSRPPGQDGCGPRGPLVTPSHQPKVHSLSYSIVLGTAGAAVHCLPHGQAWPGSQRGQRGGD